MKLKKSIVIGGSALALSAVMLSTSTSSVYAQPTTTAMKQSSLSGPSGGQANPNLPVQWWGQAAAWAAGGGIAGSIGSPAGAAAGAAGGFIGYALSTLAGAYAGIVKQPALAERALD